MESTDWIDRAGRSTLRLSLAIVFIWFGLLKLADLCPLAGFIGRTVPFLPATPIRLTLGCWEIVIGVCLLVPAWLRLGLGLLFFHLPGTFLPLIVIPGECFTHFPIGLTVEGQYIVKNLVLASAALAAAIPFRRPIDQFPIASIIPVAIPVSPAIRPPPVRNADRRGHKPTKSPSPVMAARKIAQPGRRPKAVAP